MTVADPFFFGRSLFGCYHAPAPGVRARIAVVLCHPLGHEYSLSHRALRQLARQLAEAGHPVLRFDFFGCGDSGGVTEDATLARWREDIGEAIVELRRRSGAARVCLGGARLGATLAWLEASTRRDIGALVVWDPILHGADYFEAMKAERQIMLRRAHVSEAGRNPDPRLTELLGFQVNGDFLSELKRLALPDPARALGVPLFWIDSADDPQRMQIASGMTSRGTVERRVVRGAFDWSWIENPSKVLVPPDVLRQIVHWIGGLGGHSLEVPA